MKIVISVCFGGYGLSDEALKLYNQYSGKDVKKYHNIARNDQHLVRVVEELGEKADARFSKLEIIEIPDDVKWHIHEYDGSETIHEDHRSWPGEENC